MVSIVLVVLLGTSAGAQSISVHENSCGSCNFDVEQFIPRPVTVSLSTGGVVSGFTGAEFRVVGMPDGWFIFNLVSPFSCPEPCNPISSEGIGFRLPSCIRADCIDLFQFMIFPTTDHVNVELSIVARGIAPDPGLDCPLVNLCNPPAFTRVCVEGGRALINSTKDCQVAVEATTWSQVKTLYD